MDDAYREYFYESLVDQEVPKEELRQARLPFPIRRPGRDADGPAQVVAFDALDRVRQDYPLRPDAELLLLLLAREFVTRPIANVRGPLALQGKLSSDLETDLRTVLDTALEERTDDEITSHGVVDAFSRRWDQLRTASENVWG
jgi:hypothetical protein